MRDLIVPSTFSGSVVAKTNLTYSGGSSTSLSSALKPWVETMCASSITYTLNRLATGAKKARSRRSRASSTPPWLAASISITSIEPGPSGARARQDSHSPHGSGVGPFAQLSERARMRAEEVLPQPRGPEKRYAWCSRPRPQRLHQRLGDVLLADDLGERARPVLAVERQRHRPPPLDLPRWPGATLPPAPDIVTASHSRIRAIMISRS